MRPVFFLFLFFACSFISVSDCDTHIQFKKGAVVTQTLYDEKGKLSGIVKATCMAVNASGTAMVATIKHEDFDKNGKAASNGEYKVTCTGEKIIMDIQGMPAAQESLFLKGSSVSVSGDAIEIPVKLSVGETFPDSKMKLKFLKNGKENGSADVTIKNRKVISKESVTTSAGTFSCFKMSYDVEVSNIVMKSIKTKPGYKQSSKVNIWYNPENGIIKSVANKANGETVGSMQVTEIKK